MVKMRFLCAEFLNEHIASLVEEGDVRKAFEIAIACLGNPELDEQKKIGMANDIVDGCLVMEDEGDGAMILVSTGKPRRNAVMCRLAELEEEVEEKERAINELYVKLGDIFDALYDYPEAQKIAADVMSDANPFDDDDYIPSDVELPGMGRVNLDEALDEFIVTCNQEETPRYGWLSPDGDFHDVPWGEHHRFAWEYVHDNGIETGNENILDEADWLVEHGWILVHNPLQGIGRCTMSKDAKPTSAQKQWLYDYYMKWDDETAALAIKQGWHHEVDSRFDLI